MKISLLVPTRKRPKNILRLVQSVVDTASNLKKIEFIFKIDKDDSESFDLLFNEKINNIMIEDNPLDEIRHDVICTKRELPGKAWNDCWKNATGQIFHMCADDLVFETKDWDVLIREGFNKYPDKIVCVYGKDLIYNDITHPFVHENWTDTIGYFTPELQAYGNDSWITRLSILIQRQQFCDITHKHMHQCRKRAEMDETHLELQAFRDESRRLYRTEEAYKKRAESAKKLEDFIKGYKNE